MGRAAVEEQVADLMVIKLCKLLLHSADHGVWVPCSRRITSSLLLKYFLTTTEGICDSCPEFSVKISRNR